MATQLSALAQLAASIAANAKKVEDYLVENKLPEPSFEIDAPAEYESLLKDPTIRAAQLTLANDANKLHLLMAGHAETMKSQSMRASSNQGALRLLCHFNVAENVPLEKGISYAELAKKTGLSEDMLTRAVRLVATSYIFVEKEPGIVSHTARSKILAAEPGQKANIEFAATEAFPCVAKYVEALIASPEGNVAPFELAFGIPFFEHKKKNPEKNALFAKVMAGNKKQNRGQEIAGVFDWNRFTGTLVDVGGGIGHITSSLAKTAPNLKFVIEDLADLKPQADTYIASDNLASQITFVGHDFFQSQPPEQANASVYFLSHVLHDWPNDKCLDILKHVITAMREDSSLVLCESILPEPGQLVEYQEGTLRAQDLGMFSFLKARERSLSDLEKLVQTVDSTLKVVKLVGPPATVRNSIIEFARGPPVVG